MTGGGGFIGRALIKKLVSVGARVVDLSRREKVDDDPAHGVEGLNSNVCKRDDLKKALAGRSFEYVFNAAGYIDHSTYLEGGRGVVDVHYTGVLNLLDQVFTPSLKKFVQIGSSDEYGNAAAPQKEDMREAPISPYSAAKTAATHLVQALSRTENFPGTVVRFFLVYGPGQDENRVIPQIIRGCLEDKIFPASYGEQLRDFCYIEDVVNGLLQAAVCPKAVGEVFNIASGRPVSIRSVIEQVVALTGKGKAEFGKHPYRPGENMSLYADISKAERELGWRPETSLEEGLKKTIEYYRNSISGGQ